MPSPSLLVLLSSRNSATMVMWRHISPLYSTSMFWSTNSCQNSVSADQYRLTVSRVQVSTLWVRVFFRSYPLTSCYFSNDRRLKFNFLKCIWNKSCSSAALLISNWPRTRKFNRLLHPFDFSLHSHALVTLYVQFLCSDWSKFDRWVHAENLCSI